MFGSIFLVSLKDMIRNKAVLFWLIVFPLLLATIFYFAFVGFSGEAYKLDKSRIVVEGIENNSQFKLVLNEVSNIDGKVGEKDLFEIVKVKEGEKAADLLDEDKIDAIIQVESNNIKISVLKSSYTSSIAKMFVDNYLASESTINNILVENSYNPAVVPKVVNDLLMTKIPDIEKKEVSKNKIDVATSYYFALLAMACMYFANAGHHIVETIQLNRGEVAQRILISPVKRTKIFIANYLAYFLVGVVTILVFLLYTSFVLGINYGTGNFFLVWLTGILGVSVALNIGLFLGTLIKNPNIRDGIVIGVTMTFSLFAGLYSHQMKYMVLQNMPFINYMNPVGLIADSAYSLFLYDTLTPYFIRMGILVAFGLVFFIAGLLIIRRKKYASV